MPGRGRTALVLAIITGTLIGGAATARAAPPPTTSRPLTCLERWDDEDPRFDYVGEGWVNARVATVNGVVLGCGDEQSGVVHIGGSAVTGTGHAIDKRNEQAFLDCFGSLVRFGTKEPDPDFPETRDRYRKVFSEPSPFGDLPVVATMYVDRKRHFVYTIHTTKTKATPGSNNWAGCSGGGAVA
jgi:hypothetical protein